MNALQPNRLSAADAEQAINNGALSAEELMSACLSRVREVEPAVRAWQYLDPDYGLAQARARDAERREGRPVAPLHGVPVGVTDIFDTEDMPTTDGTLLHHGRSPTRDATAVAMLRAAGAVIMGKTATTEFGTDSFGTTRNPRNPAHTAGGSSSGSAAAVAAGMATLALGGQINGSVIRAASYCGIYGFTPTHGLIPRGGALTLSRTLDRVGVFGRSLEDVALIAEQLIGNDLRDPDTSPKARPPLVATLAEDPPLPPLLACLKDSGWENVESETRAALAELAGALDDRVIDLELPVSARQAVEWHQTILEVDMAANLDPEWERGRDRLSASLRGQLARGRQRTGLEYLRAQARIPAIVHGLEEIFERCDAILTFAAPGTAPRGLEYTADPGSCTLWILCGMPALTLPLMDSGDGLPIGAQLVGRRGSDARLLRTARWLVRRIGESG